MMEEEDNYLFAYLDKDIEDAKTDIKSGKGLSQKGATAMLLKGMYNHIAHLDVELSDIRKNMLTRSEFDFLKWLISIGFVFLAAFQAYFGFTAKMHL
jgi:hypothetical protein